MGLCPDNRVSGGKVLKAKTRKVPSRPAYDESEAFKATPSSQAKRLQNLQKQAQSFGYQLVAA